MSLFICLALLSHGIENVNLSENPNVVEWRLSCWENEKAHYWLVDEECEGRPPDMDTDVDDIRYPEI